MDIKGPITSRHTPPDLQNQQFTRPFNHLGGELTPEPYKLPHADTHARQTYFRKANYMPIAGDKSDKSR